MSTILYLYPLHGWMKGTLASRQVLAVINVAPPRAGEGERHYFQR